MAMIDYGALVFKNGVQLNEGQFFMDMLDAVGWVDKPRVRYDDCDCINKYGESDCGNCPRRSVKHMSDPELGEWDATTGDCRGAEIRRGGLDGNYFAYIGDRELTFCFYKTLCVAVLNGEIVAEYYGAQPYTDGFCPKSKVRLNAEIPDGMLGVIKPAAHIRIKQLDDSRGRVYHFRTRYKDDRYDVIYGYGIDPDKKVWDSVKVQYLGKKLAAKVDRLCAIIMATAVDASEEQA